MFLNQTLSFLNLVIFNYNSAISFDINRINKNVNK